MSRLLKKAGRAAVDFIEVYLPIGVFIAMFVVFLTNIFARYVLRNPQNWTFEFSVNSFVIVGLLGACIAYRLEDHVVFDLVYVHRSPRGQALMRILSHLLVIGFLGIALPSTIRSLANNPAVTSIMKIPDKYIYAVLPVMMISMVARSLYRLVLDVKAVAGRTYTQTYNTEQKDALV
jgi:TRAP-type C4-dicarboxylate transport system permease small subunit